MLDHLGQIINDLYVERQKGIIPRKKLIFIVGNGISPVSNILNDEDIVKIIGKLNRKRGTRRKISTNPKSRSFQELKWKLFEYSRYYTSNALPTFTHACIFRTIFDKICSNIITTNYDLFFDGIWLKYPELKIVQNPVLSLGEYHWENYYTERNKTTNHPHYWKIHGSLSHIVFRGLNDHTKHQILRLPRFSISSNQPDLARGFKGNCLAPFLGYESQESPVSDISPPHYLRPNFEPFIDWTFQNNRDLFAREIEAIKHLLTKKREIAAIVMIGFRGYYNFSDPNDRWNEELVPSIQMILDEGDIPVFMIVHSNQFKRYSDPTSVLMRRLHSMGLCKKYDDIGEFADQLFESKATKFPYDEIENEYKLWRNQWFLTLTEERYEGLIY